MPHRKRVAGFPIDPLSKRLDSGEYYYDAAAPLEDSLRDGFRDFFMEALGIKEP